MSDKNEPRDPLVDHLEALAADENRAVLAQLRASLTEERALDGLHVVLPFIPPDAHQRTSAEDDALLLAGLFALHPEPGPRSLASVLAEIKRASDSESIELRFRALLGASRADLPTHLRHAVALAASHKLPIDWRNLHCTIRFWAAEEDHARRKWARDFWTPLVSTDPTPVPL